jgi:hypothetical protein
MNNFLSNILIQNTVAEYEIYKKGNQFKALLIVNMKSSHLPRELAFWKENGQWRASHMLSEHVLYQFGYNIDNQVMSAAIEEIKACA